MLVLLADAKPRRVGEEASVRMEHVPLILHEVDVSAPMQSLKGDQSCGLTFPHEYGEPVSRQTHSIDTMLREFLQPFIGVVGVDFVLILRPLCSDSSFELFKVRWPFGVLPSVLF